jgi:hypothetical protein
VTVLTVLATPALEQSGAAVADGAAMVATARPLISQPLTAATVFFVDFVPIIVVVISSFDMCSFIAFPDPKSKLPRDFASKYRCFDPLLPVVVCYMIPV